MLRIDRAAGEAQREALVQPLHLLQEHEVGVERAQAVAQLVDHQAPVELRQALVDVERDDAQAFFHRSQLEAPLEKIGIIEVAAPHERGRVPPPLAHRARRGDAHRPEEEALGALGAGDQAVGAERAGAHAAARGSERSSSYGRSA